MKMENKEFLEITQYGQVETGRAGLRFVLGSQSNRLCSSEMPGYFIALLGLVATTRNPSTWNR